MDDASILARARADGRAAATTATWRRPRSGSPTSTSPTAGVATSTPPSAWSADDADLGGGVDRRRRAQLADRQPADRGQPAVLLPHDRARARRRRRRGVPGSERWTAEEGRHSMAIYGYLMVTRAVDPRRPRARPDGPGLDRRGPRAAHAVDVLRLRRPAGAGHPHRPPQHRSAARRQRRLRRHDARRRRREPAPPLLPRPRHGGHRARPVHGRCRRSSARSSTFEMPGTGIPGFAAHAAAISQAGIYDLTIHHDQILAARRPAPLGPSSR